MASFAVELSPEELCMFKSECQLRGEGMGRNLRTYILSVCADAEARAADRRVARKAAIQAELAAMESVDG